MPSTTNKKVAAATAQPSSSSASSSRKRKLNSDKPTMQKFYAVRAGKKPGVYLTYEECQAQTTGFSGAVFKSFPKREDADAFVAGKNPAGTSKKDQAPRFYAVAVGGRPGIYLDWAECSEAYPGVPKPKYKKFGTREEAEEFIRTWGNDAAKRAIGDDVDGDEGDEDEDDEEVVVPPAAKRAKTSATKMAVEDPNVLKIYTDGSSLSNGRTTAAAGVGVFFGINDERNISERLIGKQTNQRAELTAVLRALETVDNTQDVAIYSDSKYSISCVTEWFHGWDKRDWKTSQGKDVENQDLIKSIRVLIEARDKVGAKTGFTWVKGHSSNAGNAAADRLAVKGAQSRG